MTPIYNTGNDFIYPDNFADSLQTYLPESLGGTWTTLACAECNNGHGHKIEADLLAQHGSPTGCMGEDR